MKNYFKQVIFFLEQYSPYVISSQPPKQLKKAWKRSLFSAPKRYWILYIYSLSFWKIIETLKIAQSRYRKNTKVSKNKLLRLI